MTLAVVEPTLGCRQLADRLAERGYRDRQDHGAEAARRPRPGPSAQRVARAAAITAATTGLSTDAARDSRAVRVLPLQPSTRLPGGDGQLLHRQPQRRRQGVPADRHRRRHPVGDHAHRCRPAYRRPHDPLHRPRRAGRCRRLGVPVRAGSPTTDPSGSPAGSVLTSPPCGSPTSASRRAHATTTPSANGFRHRPAVVLAARLPPSPLPSIRQLQAEADTWLVRYHHRRRNHSDYMRGRTPAEILDNHRARQAS